MNKQKEEFILEKAEDLSINKNECPLSSKIREIWIQYSTKNPILDNGQMVCLNYNDNIEIKIMNHFQRLLIEYIESEKTLNECRLIKTKYESNTDNINNSSKYVKLIFDIIVNMDRCYKYVWNIAKLLNDNIKSYKNFTEWQQGKIKVDPEVLKEWDFIYSIRNKIEHPEDLNTTSFQRTLNGSKSPKIIIKEKEYDLLELGEKSLISVLVISKAIIAISFLYSKFAIYFTDETRTTLYKG